MGEGDRIVIMPELMGYVHPGYALSLREFGEPHELPHSGGWILIRPIPDISYRDAMGCYPLYSCQDWSQLHRDLADLKDEKLVSLALIADPFGSFDLHYLHKYFDLMIPFKEHFVLDLRGSINAIITKHHLYYARKALKQIEVEICSQPVKWLDEWVELYRMLTEMHNIKGIRAFSRTAFEGQLAAPGMVMFRASAHGVTVGMELWYVQADIAYSHLSACNTRGYELGSAYALRWSSIEHYVQGREVRWLNHGGGLTTDGSDGLSRFKKGWSNGTRKAYFCGHILDHEKYSAIVGARGITNTNYFPAYRNGEFF